MSCRTAETLFKHFVEATKHHVEATELLANLVGSRARFAEARLRVKETLANCKAAHSALTAHRKHHYCGISSLQTANHLSEEHPS